jgi:hypothetical protein
MSEQVKTRWVEVIGSLVASIWIIAIAVTCCLPEKKQDQKIPPGDISKADYSSIYR